MPTHRVPRGTLHEDLIDIERVQCERVMSIVVDPDDTGFYLVETKDRPDIETRAAVCDPLVDVWTNSGHSS